MINNKDIHKTTIREKILYIIKLISPIFAIILLIVLVVWPILHKSENANIRTHVDTGSYANLTTSVTNGTMLGTTANGDTYSIKTYKTYKYIDKQNKKDELFHLVHTRLIQNFINGDILKINGTSGILNRTKNLIYLSDGVYILNNNQDKSYTKTLNVDIKNKYIHTTSPVVEWGETGFFTSNKGLSYNLNKKIITLKGKSRIVMLATTPFLHQDQDKKGGNK